MSGVQLASQNVVCRRLSGNLKNFLVALADHAVIGVYHQSGEWRVAAAMRFVNHHAQDSSDPVMEQSPGAYTCALLNLLGKLLVGDDRVIRACQTDEQGVGLTCPALSGLRRRHGSAVGYAPIAMLRHTWFSKVLGDVFPYGFALL
ncbi:hypothetical protein [Streptosporangium subroseum]|uniref:hypothetical protein n=1 Tax=Streptosporangium subroseum TaxID=106412 RepID=UPI0015C66DB3|nr:hypothetical protein [Streptosporangium subroseum]